MPFDINTQDVTEQNVLYISSVLGNVRIVEFLLNYKVKARKVKEEEPSTGAQPTPQPKRRISSGIQRLMSSLNFMGRSSERKDENLLCPLNLDLYCNNNTQTALHAAVKARHTDVISVLLLVRIIIVRFPSRFALYAKIRFLISFPTTIYFTLLSLIHLPANISTILI
jgi:ankyrin repeat protein